MRETRLEIFQYTPSPSIYKRKVLFLAYPCELEISHFAKEVLREESLYLDVADVNFFWSKLDISATENEEDVVVTPCDVRESVCDQRMVGVMDEYFLMYMVVLDEFGVTIPFMAFEMDMLKLLNVAPLQIRPNSWAFIPGFEIHCKDLSLEPSVGVFFHFYGTKDVNKGTWISISSDPGKNFFFLMLLTLRRSGVILLLGCRGRPSVQLYQ
jgi:hypothetical protein